jgi:glutamate-1-semialdehyde 2,1-aminomutase
MTTNVGRHVASGSAYERALHLFPGGVNSSRRELNPPLVFSKSSGAYVTDVDGNRYTDFQLGFGAIVLGHNHPAVSERVREVLGEVDLVGAGANSIEIAFAEEVIDAVPSAERLHFCGSGSEAVMHALRLARAATRRTKVMMFNGCYHGWALPSLLDRPSESEQGDSNTAITHWLVDPEDLIIAVDYNDLAAVEEVLRLQGEQIAAIIVEPISHNVGTIIPDPGFLEGLRRLATKYGSILIFDEVISGFRHALGGYQSICGVLPDLSVFAKCMANGFPVACICGSAHLMDLFSTGRGPVPFGGTFNAFPGSMAAGLATIDILKRPDAHARLYGLGEMLRTNLSQIVADRELPCQVAGFGSVHILYFFEGSVRSHRDTWRNDDESDVKFRQGMIARGFFMLTHPRRRSYLSLQHSDEDIARYLEAASDTLASIYQ